MISGEHLLWEANIVRARALGAISDALADGPRSADVLRAREIGFVCLVEDAARDFERIAASLAKASAFVAGSALSIAGEILTELGERP